MTGRASPRVNLLPASYAERIAERRRVGFTGAALGVLLLLLALLSFVQGRTLTEAQEQRDVEQAHAAAMQAQRAKLTPYRELAESVTSRERLLSASMGNQVSWAEVLASLSTRFPTDASLTDLSAESLLPTFATTPAPKPGDTTSMVGTTAMHGYSVAEFRPGVRRILELLAAVSGVARPRLHVGERAEINGQQVTTFDGATLLDGAVLTGRYATGLPPEDDVVIPTFGIGGTGAASTGTGTTP